MHLAATARTVLADPVVGPAYQQLLDSGKRSNTHTQMLRADTSCIAQPSVEPVRLLRCCLVWIKAL